jgi:hypothetical protein
VTNWPRKGPPPQLLYSPWFHFFRLSRWSTPGLTGFGAATDPSSVSVVHQPSPIDSVKPHLLLPSPVLQVSDEVIVNHRTDLTARECCHPKPLPLPRRCLNVWMGPRSSHLAQRAPPLPPMLVVKTTSCVDHRRVASNRTAARSQSAVTTHRVHVP